MGAKPSEELAGYHLTLVMNGLSNNLKPLSLLGAGFALGILVKTLYRGEDDPIIPSPRETQLPYLSPSEKAKLPYPPDVLPGARDIPSPYGSLRVYEWGPEHGRRVLMVHGISTPSIALGADSTWVIAWRTLIR